MIYSFIPQMSPMYWLLIFFYILMIMYIYMSILYFSSFSYSPITHNNLKIKLIKKTIKF